jgi:uncharacterized protein
MNLTVVNLPKDRLAEFCRRWDIVRLEVFGSALRDDFGPESDIDFLVTFAPEARRSLFDLIGAEEELSQMLGRKVDLVSRPGVERSRNWIRRREILGTARLLYAA